MIDMLDRTDAALTGMGESSSETYEELKDALTNWGGNPNDDTSRQGVVDAVKEVLADAEASERLRRFGSKFKDQDDRAAVVTAQTDLIETLGLGANSDARANVALTNGGRNPNLLQWLFSYAAAGSAGGDGPANVDDATAMACVSQPVRSTASR